MAEVGASAALAGLIFVGVSINLTKILSLPNLPGRAFEALLLLLAVLVVCSLLLVPGQPQNLVGIEVLLIGLTIWVTIILFDIHIWKNTEAEYRAVYRRIIVVNQAALLPYVISGLWILLYGFSGIYWLVPAMILSFVLAIMDAWVLLVEINR